MSGLDEKKVQKWFIAFQTQIKEMHLEGERKPDFCIAWCATCHLHKIVNAENAQDKFLGSRCNVHTDDQDINIISVRICEAACGNMGDEMKTGVISSLEKFNELEQ